MAFSKQHKTKLIAQYVEWLKSSQGLVLLSYKKMSMKDIDTLRAKVRETGSELHVIKNTLMAIACKEVGIDNTALFDESSLVGFAFSDVPALAKTLTDATAKSEIFAIKGGYLGSQAINVNQVKALGELPPLPVMRAMLLGTINAPASKLVRTLAEPARGLAAVIKANSEKGEASTAA